ncbi:MAG: S-layer homology domain-containing protein [Sedimentibacter saalensis]|uniref:S-layer homology domain-containing protein n=1 Tax=Sedimentibacter saalensis TaxID=130788 RepID=UPI002B1EC428|nr:S-layer homology domain-containing protein [Sedimentibacter saalensis]MEA5095448.1 S-layer homology domain-containing protein [Sedimentibacter saalensis]
MNKNKINKKVTCFVIALMMVMPIIPNYANTAEAITVPSENDIVLDKNALPTEVENTYEIQLSVKGKDIITGKKVDVILVVDNSNSMHDTKDKNNKSLAEITRNAAYAFINGVLTPSNSSSGNVKVAVVQYGTYARARQFTGESNWTNTWSSGLEVEEDRLYTLDIAQAKLAIDSATTQFNHNSNDSGGTNTEGGFLMSSKVAEVKSNDAESVIIFMTDGMPTFRYNSDDNAVSDGSSFVNGGTNTSKSEFNQAIESAQSLGIGRKIYTVALLSAFSNTSDEAKLASNLLSKLPMTYISKHDTRSIKGHVDDSDRWDETTSYAEKYYPIFSGDNASDKMQEIYETLAGTINALAEGSVTDVIPKDFELTTDSKSQLESLGVSVTVNGDGTTTLVFPNISASEAVNNLPKYTVQVKPGVYGTGFTNEYAKYEYTLNTTGAAGSKNFPEPLVAINPTAANDDGYEVNVGKTLTIDLLNNILLNDETFKLEQGGYTVEGLSVEPRYATTITTVKNGSVVLSSDGTFVYNPPSSTFVGTDTFVYKNTATVSGEGPLAGNYVSNEANVTITVLPLNSAAYKVEHYLENSDFVTYSLKETDYNNGVINETVYAESNNYTGYYLDSSVEETISSGDVTQDGNLTLKLFYSAYRYNVYYYPNGGSGELSDGNKPYIYEEEVIVLENEFINDGYNFVGWGYGDDSEYETVYLPDDTFKMPNSNINLYALWELGTEETLNYTVEYYVDGELYETKELLVPASNPIVSAVSYDNMPDTYYVDENLSTDLPFEVEVEASNVIKVYYEKKTQEPQEPENNITIKHYTKTGSASEVLALTEYRLVTVTTGSSIVTGQSYKNNTIIAQGFAYQSSTPESHEIFANTTTESAFATYTFELRYYKEGSSDNGGGNGGGGGTIITDPLVPLADLEKSDHFAYVIGYPEGDVRPLNNITREEVAMIFYRLLTDESRNNLLSDSNSFTDLENHEWSNRAISTLFNAGIIKGYPDGTFKPSDPISRAEFATIAAKFDKFELVSTSKFTDIFGHWAEKYITSSEIKGWIKGYPDLTFKPEQDITRAEAMTLINNVLGRLVPEENIHPEAMHWNDMATDDWYFETVMEATNSHDYIYEEDGDELWTGLKANKLWP